MHIGDTRLKYQQLWSGLKSASIYIKDLSVREIGSDLLDYLKAYFGLQKLTVVGERLFNIGHMDDVSYAIAAEEEVWEERKRREDAGQESEFERRARNNSVGGAARTFEEYREKATAAGF